MLAKPTHGYMYVHFAVSLLIGHENNVHCLAIAVNAIAGAVFAFYSGQDQKDKMKEFIIVNYSNSICNAMSFHIVYIFSNYDFS